jgi:type IV fimbrial biogenesis protein FimT
MADKRSGFTIIELLVVIAILGVLMVVGVPTFFGWIPEYRLRTAADDLYANLQFAKINAIKGNRPWAVVFNPGADSYDVRSDYNLATESTVRQVNLASYGSGIGFGHAGATTPVDGQPFGDEVSFPGNAAEFNPRGMSNTVGFAYIENNVGGTRAAGTRAMAGVVILRAWKSGWK